MFDADFGGTGRDGAAIGGHVGRENKWQFLFEFDDSVATDNRGATADEEAPLRRKSRRFPRDVQFHNGILLQQQQIASRRINEITQRIFTVVLNHKGSNERHSLA